MWLFHGSKWNWNNLNRNVKAKIIVHAFIFIHVYLSTVTDLHCLEHYARD